MQWLAWKEIIFIVLLSFGTLRSISIHVTLTLHLSYSLSGDHDAVISSIRLLPREVTSPTGTVASLPAVASGHGHCFSSHRLLWDCDSLITLKIWVLLPTLQVLCFLLSGWWTKAGQGWEKPFCWRIGLAYTVMKLCIGRTEASRTGCLREKIRKKVCHVMERKEIFSWISGLTFVGIWSSFPRETQ